jgi:hypothetical protein
LSELNTPTNYHDFRKRFLDGVAKQQLQLQSLQVRGLSPQGKPLFTDIAHNVMNPQLPTLVHISGCHGIEGYLGSSIQSALLGMDEFPIEALKKMNFVFVHVVNPYGMSWYRRVNAHNVDLNRNYYREEAERPENKEFDLFAPLFEKRIQEKKWKIWKTAIFAFLKFGVRKTAGVIAKGQYHQPESLFYGGTSLEPEIQDLMHALKKTLKDCKKIYVMDVHSGLGKFGSENWILDGLQSEEDEAFWKQALDEAPLINPMNDKSFYKAQGTLADAFRDSFSEAHVLYVFEEFGTFSLLKVIRTLLQENKTFLKLKLDRLRAFLMIATFFPYEKGWRIKAISDGKHSFFRVVEALKRSS